MTETNCNQTIKEITVIPLRVYYLTSNK